MPFHDVDIIADFLAEDPIERAGVLGFGLSTWIVSIVNEPPTTILHSVIQIIPPLLGIWVAHRSMERAHELRMEKMKRTPNAVIPPNFPYDRKEAAKPDEPTVDVP